VAGRQERKPLPVEVRSGNLSPAARHKHTQTDGRESDPQLYRLVVTGCVYLCETACASRALPHKATQRALCRAEALHRHCDVAGSDVSTLAQASAMTLDSIT
jgi:hypothetical protein